MTSALLKSLFILGLTGHGVLALAAAIAAAAAAASLIERGKKLFMPWPLGPWH